MIKTVLVVEDESPLANMYKIAFELKNIEVDIASDGASAIAKVLRFKPDLVLLDIMMPKVNGFEFLQAIRKNSSLQPQIVVNSNLEQKDDEQTATDLGANFYLRKSKYTAREIVSKVENYNETGKWQ